jgi:hypothetical protein
MKALPVIVAALLVCGCATYVWSRADATPEILARDQSECQEEARYAARGYDLSGFRWGGWARGQPLPPVQSGLEIEQELFRRCMEFRGYRLEKETSQRG